MEPQPSRLRSQWFEGWFLRLIDHETSSSIAVIFGSLRRKDREPTAALADSPFDEHLIVIGYSDGRDGGGQHEQRVLLDGPSVRLAGGGGPSTSSAGPRLSWWSDAHGGMVVDGNLLTLDLALPDGMRLVANASGTRVPWDARSPDTYGPEGWLSRTGLLPCHYFVHSFGSRTQYALWHRRNTQNNALWNRPTGIGSEAPLLIGEARTHVERNWGDSFPTGWVWAQAALPNDSAYLVLTGGRFKIGPLTTDSYIIGLRAAPNGAEEGASSRRRALHWDFRTTDLDRVSDHRMPCDGRLAINATSRDGSRRIELVLSAPPSSFGRPLHVPTSDRGFSDEPGCRESPVATVSITAWERRFGDGGRGGDRPWWWREASPRLRAVVPLGVLEFGGGYQC